MKKLKIIVVIICLFYLIGGFYINSTYVEQKQEVAFAELKEKYGIEEAPVTEPRVIEETETIQPEEPVVEVPDNRTTEQKVWDFLKGAGYSEIQAAAIIGNLYAESGLRPDRVEMENSEGFGLAQWSFGRKANLKAFCASRGVGPDDLYSQLEFLVGEINSKEFKSRYKKKFDSASNVNEAAEAFCWGFERPRAKTAHLQFRKDKSVEVYNNNKVDR